MSILGQDIMEAALPRSPADLLTSYIPVSLPTRKIALWSSLHFSMKVRGCPKEKLEPTGVLGSRISLLDAAFCHESHWGT